jgi:hypothetical protein
MPRLLESGAGVWLVGDLHGIPVEGGPRPRRGHGTIWGHLNDEKTDATASTGTVICRP